MASKQQAGFTIVELIAVMVIISVIAVSFSSLLRDGSSNVLAGRDDLVAALFYAQQVAMARDSNTNPITFRIINNNTITVEENGSPLTDGGVTYPLNMPAGITLAPTNLMRDYDKLGRTTATVITVSGGGGSAQVTLSASGYAN